MKIHAGAFRAAGLWLLLALPAVAQQTQTQMQAQARYEFSLPAQPLADSLRAVGRKAHVTVAFDPDAVTGMRAPPLSGKYSAKEALERLLRGKRLRLRTTSGGSFWVEMVPLHGPPAG